jgi:hypothetical protein
MPCDWANEIAPGAKPVVETAVTLLNPNRIRLPTSCSIHDPGAGPWPGRSRHSMSQAMLVDLYIELGDLNAFIVVDAFVWFDLKSSGKKILLDECD